MTRGHPETADLMSADNFNAVAIIRKKRNGEDLSDGELQWLIDAYTADRLPDYQMSAFLMAAFLNGMSEREAAVWTRAMLRSGRTVDLSDLPGRKVDKHSTGGVGDKISLVLAPIVAGCGVPVPMISGRGLGHTGGTLDKLESIPGFGVEIPLVRYREILEKRGLVMCGQTEEIAPADKRLYALRDVTATVESIPLIASSIMSKKLAEGIDALVLDVKFGSGAFLPETGRALELAETLVAIGERSGVETVAWLTSMEQPLGRKVGNWLEVEEAIECLQGGGPADVMKVTHRLAGTMIRLGGKAESVEEGMALSRQAVESGRALDCWEGLVAEQGGDPQMIRHPERYPVADIRETISAGESGYVTAIDARQIGLASVELGAGRRIKEDTIDPEAGIVLEKKIGDTVKKGETIATAFTNNDRAIEEVTRAISGAFAIGSDVPQPGPMISHRVDRSGIEKIDDIQDK